VILIQKVTWGNCSGKTIELTMLGLINEVEA